MGKITVSTDLFAVRLAILFMEAIVPEFSAAISTHKVLRVPCSIHRGDAPLKQHPDHHHLYHQLELLQMSDGIALTSLIGPLQ